MRDCNRKVNPKNEADSAEFWAKHFPYWYRIEFAPLKGCICSALSLIRKASRLLVSLTPAAGRRIRAQLLGISSIKWDWFIRAGGGERNIWWVIEICVTAVAPSSGNFCAVAVGLMSPIKEVNTQVSDSCSRMTENWRWAFTLNMCGLSSLFLYVRFVLPCLKKLTSSCFSARYTTSSRQMIMSRA